MCEVCDGTWEVKIKNKILECPEYKGNSIHVDDFEGEKELVAYYNKAKLGDLQALKDLILIEGSDTIKIVEL